MTSASVPLQDTRAVVIGLCAHGLALVRGLAKTGIAVTALEADTDLPGYNTRYAQVLHVNDINGPGLIDTLKNLRKEWDEETNPIIFLTNDNMVRTIGEHWMELDGLYELSWSKCREVVLQLLRKDSLVQHCKSHKLNYPASRVLEDEYQLEAWKREVVDFPLIVKPIRPLSGFKVRLVEDHDALSALVSAYRTAMPFLVQQWIPGGDERILFTALYLDNGNILASFGGRKLASKPAAQGQTTVAESFVNEEMRELAERFFRPLNLSGPVSLEAKMDEFGKLWVIEPTIGRTDYWLDCCIANNVNLPQLEYLSQRKQEVIAPTQNFGVIWFDTERSPLSYLMMRIKRTKTSTYRWKARFAYWDSSDQAPFRHAIIRLTRRVGTKIIGRLLRLPPKPRRKIHNSG